MKALTVDHFKAHFERTFFGEHSKRLDFELNSELHKEAQAEWRAKNDEKWGGQRIEVKGGLPTFKKMMGLHPDLFKANFASYKM